MFKNYPIAIGFKIAWRNMQKQKMYALINIGGFAIGIAAGLVVLAIALATVSFQAVKAAMANPVKSLRSE